MLKSTLEQNIKLIEKNIQTACDQSQRSRADVQLICVSKSVDVETTQQVVDLGILHLAENRMEPFLHKKEALGHNPNITWHYIGHLQRRKVKSVINEIDYFHALDTLSLAEEIHKRATKKIKCFVQVNVSGEESKQGVHPDELDHFILQLEPLTNIEVVGLMTMAPYDAHEKELSAYFCHLKKLQREIASTDYSYAPCTELSMGMSGDYQLAIQSGTTFIRVGSRFFNQ